MTEYSATSSSVIVTNAVAQSLVAGEAIAAGELIYLKSSDGKVYKAQRDGTVEEATVLGIAGNSAATGQPVQYYTGGTVALQSGIFTTPGAAQLLVLGPTAGRFSDASDLDAVNDHYVSVIGWALDADSMKLAISNTGIQRPSA